ncbi:probable E3 ubiquitin-protein ligase makorin-1 [Gigantopelta aegis]|uniref:probable E3 ubiquitin-protein ligase makorin-1 n=1 Tax=Gigantopelta aegis TaxID=1735272 RepID=UPI001B88E383|nr:probable E3 ubiquitin-protein ligase makorin-1 [Gigantopelta aegis]
MAEAGSTQSSSIWTNNVLCRYFIHGVCREGDSCRYSHDRSAQPSMVCRFYIKGRCTYGEKCRYDHVKPSCNSITDKENQPASKTSPSKMITSSFHKPIPLSNHSGDTFKSNMVSLKKGVKPVTPSEISTTVCGKPDDEWVKAKEFIPGQPYQGAVPETYAKAALVGTPIENTTDVDESQSGGANPLLCPFAANGECWYGENCEYIHGDVCDLCGLAILDPNDPAQREQHVKDCMNQHEEDMELSFAVARSENKACGICMDIVIDKQPPSERRFGILPNCNHCFCLSCIRKWRCAKQFENKIIRACPECRVLSDFVTPSKYWHESKEDKEKLIEGYKSALSQKPCRYFDEGRGECPFNEKCFYLHAYPDGRVASPQPRTVRKRKNADGEFDLVRHIQLWDFLEERDERSNLLILEEEFLSHLLLDLMLDSSSEDSDDDFW